MLINSLDFKQIVGNTFGSILLDNVGVEVGLNGVLGVFVELENKFFEDAVLNFGVLDEL